VRSAAAETTEIAGMSSLPDPEAAEEATTRIGRELDLSLDTMTAATPTVALSRAVRAATARETTGCRTVLGTDVEVVAAETRAGDLERVEHEDTDRRRTGLRSTTTWSFTAAVIDERQRPDWCVQNDFANFTPNFALLPKTGI
jgi:hypothetical protein